MTNTMMALVGDTVQCWGCPVFDRLFQIISTAAAGFYDYFSDLCLILLMAMFTVYVINAIWQNAKNNFEDTFYKKSVQKVFINSIVAISLMGAGVIVPRFITMITFEPIAQMTLTYSQAMINQTQADVDERVTYQPVKIKDDGFYRPELRDTIINIMKTTITQFQSYIKLGIAVMDSAFSWSALFGIGALIKHIVLFFIGLYLAWGFFKLFFRYCCYFADAIVAMAFFAFFFPLSLATFAFNGADSVPDVIKKIGKGVGVNQIKNLISSIVTLGSVIITYTVIMAIIAKFFSATDVSNVELMNAITSGDIFEKDLSAENLEALTLTSCIALMYVLNYVYKQIPQITKMILGAFEVEEKKEYGEKIADDLMSLTKNVYDTTVNVGKIILNGGKEEKKEGSK
ncbi:MAG: hypothetical protein J6R52_01075 [Alphaproteobacteria bacterium]|nr:hypothetical protein [Alphaproteobacteria bacterium]